MRLNFPMDMYQIKAVTCESYDLLIIGKCEFDRYSQGIIYTGIVNLKEEEEDEEEDEFAITITIKNIKHPPYSQTVYGFTVQLMENVTNTVLT